MVVNTDAALLNVLTVTQSVRIAPVTSDDGQETQELSQALTASKGSRPSRGVPPSLLQNSATLHWVQKFQGPLHNPCLTGDITT